LYEREYAYLLDLNEATFEITRALLRNEMPGTREEKPAYTTEWANADTDASWGDNIGILDRLFKYGPLAMMK
jgi:hypothetical protein